MSANFSFPEATAAAWSLVSSVLNKGYDGAKSCTEFNGHQYSLEFIRGAWKVTPIIKGVNHSTQKSSSQSAAALETGLCNKRQQGLQQLHDCLKEQSVQAWLTEVRSIEHHLSSSARCKKDADSKLKTGAQYPVHTVYMIQAITDGVEATNKSFRCKKALFEIVEQTSEKKKVKSPGSKEKTFTPTKYNVTCKGSTLAFRTKSEREAAISKRMMPDQVTEDLEACLKNKHFQQWANRLDRLFTPYNGDPGLLRERSSSDENPPRPVTKTSSADKTSTSATATRSDASGTDFVMVQAPQQQPVIHNHTVVNNQPPEIKVVINFPNSQQAVGQPTVIYDSTPEPTAPLPNAPLQPSEAPLPPQAAQTPIQLPQAAQAAQAPQIPQQVPILAVTAKQMPATLTDSDLAVIKLAQASIEKYEQQIAQCQRQVQELYKGATSELREQLSYKYLANQLSQLTIETAQMDLQAKGVIKQMETHQTNIQLLLSNLAAKTKDLTEIQNHFLTFMSTTNNLISNYKAELETLAANPLIRRELGIDDKLAALNQELPQQVDRLSSTHQLLTEAAKLELENLTSNATALQAHFTQQTSALRVKYLDYLTNEGQAVPAETKSLKEPIQMYKCMQTNRPITQIGLKKVCIIPREDSSNTSGFISYAALRSHLMESASHPKNPNVVFNFDKIGKTKAGGQKDSENWAPIKQSKRWSLPLTGMTHV
ncbi:MAG: hypothetical protein ACPGUD_02545 [Parashewanella sp.]